MSKKTVVDLGGLVNTSEPVQADIGNTLSPRPAGSPSAAAATLAVPKRAKTKSVKLKKAGFLVHPVALKQFDVLRAELAGDDRKNAGVKLIGEALNLLFAKHGKPIVPLDF
jgi:hypothetical protein